ncbi:MAG TPA: hypothetical protein VF463_10630 [Sphingobium sp.]
MAVDLETRSISQLARLVAVPVGAIVPIQVDGSPAGGVPVEALFSKYLAIAVAYETAAELLLDLDHAANVIALVYADPDPANSIYWLKTGAPGSGGWVRTNVGAGLRGATGADGIEIAGLLGVAPLSANMGGFAEDIIPDGLAAKQVLQVLETAIKAILTGQIAFSLPDEANGNAVPAAGSGRLYLSAGVLKIA